MRHTNEEMRMVHHLRNYQPEISFMKLKFALNPYFLYIARGQTFWPKMPRFFVNVYDIPQFNDQEEHVKWRQKAEAWEKRYTVRNIYGNRKEVLRQVQLQIVVVVFSLQIFGKYFLPADMRDKFCLVIFLKVLFCRQKGLNETIFQKVLEAIKQQKKTVYMWAEDPPQAHGRPEHFLRKKLLL